MKLELKNVSYKYEVGTAMEVTAICQVNLAIEDGEFIGIIGQTGSGKSTLMQLMNGLVKPSEGEVLCDGINIHNKKYNKRGFHCRVGLVFQYPENQLFGATILEDVMFGPLNKGETMEEAMLHAKESLNMVGITEEYWKQSPFELSGGEKRRVAIAGVLAMQPEIMILDEPVAGLDPFSKKELLEILRNYHRSGRTVVIVSHSMDDVAEYTSRLLVMQAGSLVMDEKTNRAFSAPEKLRAVGLEVPESVKLMEYIQAAGYSCNINTLSVDEACKELIRMVKEGAGC